MTDTHSFDSIGVVANRIVERLRVKEPSAVEETRLLLIVQLRYPVRKILDREQQRRAFRTDAKGRYAQATHRDTPRCNPPIFPL